MRGLPGFGPAVGEDDDDRAASVEGLRGFGLGRLGGEGTIVSGGSGGGGSGESGGPSPSAVPTGAEDDLGAGGGDGGCGTR